MSDGLWDDEPLWQSCLKCGQHLDANWIALSHAFSSVGIEYGKDKWQMADLYFDKYHKNGHKDGRRRPDPD